MRFIIFVLVSMLSTSAFAAPARNIPKSVKDRSVKSHKHGGQSVTSRVQSKMGSNHGKVEAVKRRKVPIH